MSKKKETSLADLVAQAKGATLKGKATAVKIAESKTVAASPKSDLSLSILKSNLTAEEKVQLLLSLKS